VRTLARISLYGKRDEWKCHSTTIDEVTAGLGLATTTYSYDGLGRLTGVALETG